MPWQSQITKFIYIWHVPYKTHPTTVIHLWYTLYKHPHIQLSEVDFIMTNITENHKWPKNFSKILPYRNLRKSVQII